MPAQAGHALVKPHPSTNRADIEHLALQSRRQPALIIFAVMR
jgi:hypothetical protein